MNTVKVVERVANGKIWNKFETAPVPIRNVKMVNGCLLGESAGRLAHDHSKPIWGEVTMKTAKIEFGEICCWSSLCVTAASSPSQFLEGFPRRDGAVT